MNSFFAKLAMLIANSSVVIFLGGIIYVIILTFIDEKALSGLELNDIEIFLIYTIISLFTSMEIIEKLNQILF